MAFRLARDRAAFDGRIEEGSGAPGRRQLSAQVGGVLMAEAHKSVQSEGRRKTQIDDSQKLCVSGV